MTGFKNRALAVLLVLVFILNGVPTALAAEATATAVQLAKTEGTVAISNSSGRAVSLIEKMRVYSGYHLRTEEASYAWLNLDSAKLCKLDAVSEMEVRKSGKKLELLLDEGNLFFNVTEPLSDDESFNIRTSTMTVGIRGTCGWVRSIDQWTSQVYVLEGAVETAVSDPVTGETKSETIAAGESAVCKVYPQDRKGDKCDIIRSAYSEAEINGFVLTEVVPDEGLRGRICDDSGLDLRSSSADDRLRQDQAAVHEKLVEIESQLSRQEDHLSQNTVWSDPVPAGSYETPSDDNDDDDEDDGGSYEDGGYDPWPGPFDPPVIPDTPTIPDPPVTPRIVTLTMPQEDDTVNDYLARSTVTGVVLQPGTAARSRGTLGTARSSTANLLEVDSGITVPAGKTLTLQPGVSMSVLSGQTVQVAGSLTIGGTCAVAGTLSPASGAAVRAFAFDLTAPIPGWAVSDAADSQGYYSLIPAQPAILYTVTFNAGGGSVNPASAVTGADGKLASLPTPTREGYTFDGWFTADGTQVTESTVFAEDTTVYAHWTEIVVLPPASITYTVSFDTNGGIVSLTSAVTGADGKLASLPVPTRDGYTFDGWFTAETGGTQVTESTVFAADTTVYAHWTEIVVPPPAPVSYTVAFDAGGGSVTPASASTDADGKLTSLPTPTCEGYAFDGWFTVAGTQVTTDTVFTEDTAIYAQWKRGNMTWRIVGGTLYIGGSGPMEDYDSTNPAPWKNLPFTNVVIENGVTTVGAHAFEDCGVLKSVSMPDSVARIETNAFQGCSDLESVTIPNDVTTIGAGIFCDCTSLERVTIPEGVTAIDDLAFSGCGSLTDVYYGGTAMDWDTVTVSGDNAPLTNANIHYAKPGVTWRIKDSTLYIYGSGPMEDYDSYRINNPSHPAPWNDLTFTNAVIKDGVTSVGNWAFGRCASLTSVTIPDSVTTIGEYTFYGCTGLSSVTIPEGVTSIGKAAFYRSSSLETVTVPESVTSIGEAAFCECTSLAGVTIPKGVTTIGGSAFSECTSLTSIVIPKGVTTIGEYTFFKCKNLQSVVIPEGVTTIGEWAFEECKSLESVEIPEGVTTIGDCVFEHCTSLTSVTIPSSLANISVMAFTGCTSLGSVTIPEGVTTISGGAFVNCTSLSSAEIPSSVTSMSPGAFTGCSKLNTFVVADGNTAYASEGGVLFNRDKTTLILYPQGRPDTSYTIPASVTGVGESAFYGCTGLTSVTIPFSVKLVGASAFKGCDSLTDVNYGGTAEQWGEIDIGTNNDPLTHAAIHYAKVIVTFNANGGSVDPASAAIGAGGTLDSLPTPTCAGYTFDGWFTAADGGEEVTAGTVFTADTTVYAQWTAISVGHRIVDGTLYIEGTGKMESIDGWYASSYAPWSAHNKDIKEVIIADGVTSIGKYAFLDCSSLTSVTIPDTVTDIGICAFADCSSLTGVTIPDNVTSIGNGAFEDCSSLTGVTIPDSVTSIGDNAFMGCSSLTSVTIPDGISAIRSFTFDWCIALESVTIPASVTSIESHAFDMAGKGRIDTVNYGGTEDAWKAVAIAGGNDPLTKATINYNYTATLSLAGRAAPAHEMDGKS